MSLSNNQLRSVFADCDCDQNGHLSKHEFKCAALVVLGYKPSSIEFKHLLDGNSEVSEADFIIYCIERQKKEDRTVHIRRLVSVLDIYSRGFLTLAEVQRVFSKVVPNISDTRIEETFRYLDRTGKGKLTFGEFIDFYYMSLDIDHQNC